MKSIKHIILSLMVLLGGSQLVQAHAIWLESHPIGVKNKAHVVRVFYGEYATGEIDATKDWYSDMKELTVQLVGPNQKVQTLRLEDKGDFLEGTFLPSEDGLYHLFTSHAAKDLGGETRYEFVSQTRVKIGEGEALPMIPLRHQLSVDAKVSSVGARVPLLLTSDGKPVVEKDILVMSSAGWSKTYKTDQEGKILIEAIWPGKYVVEYSHMEQQEGVWHEKPYKKNWQGLTTSFLVE
ncbi:hypothetical protein [Sphingobacterium pedocola]|uniref:Nickel transport complex protein, NikM subunit, transmembrane n=1 Tax=Sphingobacterium pedocola TaxID=2082722 RepID=A0ABR9T450_9SPHI|nr:hypothetical protein [Sphingobacterium pedocola]MBE8719824.1 hypothetical protein [Sphingobacterium pedocola]